MRPPTRSLDSREREDVTMDDIEADDPLIEAEGVELDELADDVMRGLVAEEYAQLDADAWLDGPGPW
jgi:hypothetical protein